MYSSPPSLSLSLSIIQQMSSSFARHEHDSPRTLPPSLLPPPAPPTPSDHVRALLLEEQSRSRWVGWGGGSEALYCRRAGSPTMAPRSPLPLTTSWAPTTACCRMTFPITTQHFSQFPSHSTMPPFCLGCRTARGRRGLLPLPATQHLPGPSLGSCFRLEMQGLRLLICWGLDPPDRSRLHIT